MPDANLTPLPKLPRAASTPDRGHGIESVVPAVALLIPHLSPLRRWPTGPTNGRAGARPFYVSLFADLANGKVQNIRRRYGKDFLVDDSMWRGEAPGKPFGLEGRRRPLEFRLLHVVEFAADGDIRRENVWVDPGAVFQQLPQH